MANGSQLEGWDCRRREDHNRPREGCVSSKSSAGARRLLLHSSPVYLGIYVDCDLSMRTHALRQIRRSVPPATLQMLVVALVQFRLDYGNGVLVGLPAYLTRQLQSVLNAAARLIYRLTTRDHITDAHQSALVAGSATNSVQTGCPGVQGSTRRCATLPRSADPCRRLAWSTNTPFNECQPPRGTTRQTVNSRQPSLCGCGSTHL